MRKTEAPTVTKEGGSHYDSVETHPAYGQIGASRVSGRGVLYGSDFEHQHYVVIRISRSELCRSLSNDWAHDRDRLIEVALSEAQWASFVSTMNSGSGTQCTIEWISGEGDMPHISAPTARHEQFEGEVLDRFREILKDAKHIEKMIEEGGHKKELRSAIQHVIMGLSNGLPWVAQQFGEHMEDLTEKAKIEIGAYIEARVRHAGLKALGAEPPISLPGKKEEK